MVALRATTNDFALSSAVPIGIGLAYLIYDFVAGRKEAEASEAA